MKLQYHFYLIIAALALVISGCLYRPDIQQGNELTDEMLSSITLGMTKDEVADILGEPLITDPFNRDRWDYYYFLRDGKTGSVIRRTLFIEFIDDKISHFEGSAPPSQSESLPEANATDS
ncbi:MAG: outer membrane protein assembly factor BamE [Gammaproteobacteria bacterium]|nr:outer membrane protein assembly factor BamE [Gammaproteobacteria bacterium]MCY4219132.1 outer membrane protein assembly factor BamE [Gammaproteobacteria bacterium]MCY4275031.1 outer membrane protein assembly factor BamE [Gammaproteobacteria bacterium]